MFIIASFSLVFYFLEVLGEEKLMFPGLTKFKWPFVVTSFLIFGFYLSVSIVSSCFKATVGLAYGSRFLFSSVYFVIVAFFLFTGIRVIVSIRRGGKKLLARFSVLVTISVVGMLTFGVSYLIFGILMPTTDVEFLVLSIILTIAALVISYAQILTCKCPEKGKPFLFFKSSKKGSTSSKKSNSGGKKSSCTAKTDSNPNDLDSVEGKSEKGESEKRAQLTEDLLNSI